MHRRWFPVLPGYFKQDTGHGLSVGRALGVGVEREEGAGKPAGRVSKNLRMACDRIVPVGSQRKR